ncbi:MAG TPA: hypothetical protein DEA08_24800, partial [Planctomycetes bacterium]|nr:hypothetical protein [Planctomycetota bacterium]
MSGAHQAGEQQAIQRALDEGLLSAGDLAECLAEQSRLLAEGQQRSLEDLLVERGCLERSTWRALLGSRRVTVGQRVGPYRLRSVLGRGSMGIVYLAVDEAGEEVALKLLNAERALAGGERERFLREVRATLALEHPRIVATRDHGEDRGVPWLAMERVVGRSLRAALSAGPLPPRQAAEVALDVAEAL